MGRGIVPDPIAQIKDDKVGHPGTTRSLRKPIDFVWRLTNDSLGRGSPRDGFNPLWSDSQLPAAASTHNWLEYSSIS